jgi:hypothetical protein
MMEELHTDSIDGGHEASYGLGHVPGRGRTPTMQMSNIVMTCDMNMTAVLARVKRRFLRAIKARTKIKQLNEDVERFAQLREQDAANRDKLKLENA